MVVRSIVLCLYLALLYGLSHQMDELRMVFYPTLGAFGFLFLSRPLKDMVKIVAGAVVAVTIGNALYALSPGMLSFFITALMAVIFIQKLRINAAPIVAVSFVPFFAHPADVLTVPLSVLGSLSGLMLTMAIAVRAEIFVRLFVQLVVQWKRNPFKPKSGSVESSK
ncbi:hypothetical protein [Paenibacillus sp. MBLB4367]|uniref:hypothetical protein n=1 Tax=Paenibacillus sp. MBLB4367 TaxID=3384767 RepID=UPI0039082FD6